MDAGNTRLKWAIVPRADSGQAPPIPVEFGALRCGEPLEPEVWCAGFQVSSTELAGSNTTERLRIERQWPAAAPPLTLWNDRSRFPIALDVDEPERVGTDRLLNALAANRLRQSHQGAIVVDSGTATTIDMISSDGVFCGGAILPGLLLSARALHEYTSVLPFVPPPLSGDPVPDHVGRNTESAIISGVCWGHVGAVNGLIAAYSRDARMGGVAPLILLTGGAGPWLVDWIEPPAQLAPHLAFQGFYELVAGR